MRRTTLAVLLLPILLFACQSARAFPTSTIAPSRTFTETPFPTATASITLAPTLTPTPYPYWQYTIEYLRSRAYGGGTIEVVETVGTNSAFTRYLIRYPSDGLMIYGFMNVPHGEGPFPVIIALHGYIDPDVYGTFDYTTHYADALASAGYLVIHPNLRGYPPSDDGDNLFRVGMATDVLNLIAIVKAKSGGLELLQSSDPDRIGLWGHSMGGGITTRVLTVSRDVKAAVLYGAMSGDEQKNYEAILRWSNGTRGTEELNMPAEQLSRISAMYFFDDITASVSIHHGMADTLVPVQWSMLTCEQLKALGKNVECFYYDDMPHTFHGQGYKEFIQNTILFFDRTLKIP